MPAKRTEHIAASSNDRMSTRLQQFSWGIETAASPSQIPEQPQPSGHLNCPNIFAIHKIQISQEKFLSETGVLLAGWLLAACGLLYLLWNTKIAFSALGCRARIKVYKRMAEYWRIKFACVPLCILREYLWSVYTRIFNSSYCLLFSNYLPVFMNLTLILLRMEQHKLYWVGQRYTTILNVETLLA